MDNQQIKILLIDDDEDDFIITKDLLLEIEVGKYQLKWANNFDQAVAASKQGDFDICLIDYHLGDHTGLELMQELMERGCRWPFILLTGHGDREVDIKAMKAGAADYLA